MALIKGIAIELGGEEKVIPPLCLADLERCLPMLAELQRPGAIFNTAQINGMADVVMSSLKRNYPDVTLDQVKQWVDMGNFKDVLKAVLGSSGLEARKPGEA